MSGTSSQADGRAEERAGWARRLPWRCDPAQLERELVQLTARDWRPEVVDATGEAALALIGVGGVGDSDFAISGPMQPTAALMRCEYVRQVLAALPASVSRCRVTRLAAGARTPGRLCQEYHWFRRAPICIPIVTEPGVSLYCADQPVCMAAGEFWMFDPSRRHWMVNDSAQPCMHLVIEVRTPASLDEGARELPYVPGQPPGRLPIEPYRFEVLTPGEIATLTASVLTDAERAQVPADELSRVAGHIDELRDCWARIFARFGHDAAGELSYQSAIAYFEAHVAASAWRWLPRAGEGRRAVHIIRSMLVTSPHVTSQRFIPRPSSRRAAARVLVTAASRPREESDSDLRLPSFDRPLFILSAPRAGSTLLFETLSQIPDLWTIGQESHEIIEGIPELHPAAHGYDSNRLDARHATPAVVAALQRQFAEHAHDRDGRALVNLPAAERPAAIRFLEKTPKNALRVPFLNAAFAKARFIYLYRDPGETISSLMEGWRSRRFIAYPELPGWPLGSWSFLLPPGWASLRDHAIVDIAAHQWNAANTAILDGLDALTAGSWHGVRYSELLADPAGIIAAICTFAELECDARVECAVRESLPISRLTLSQPSADKWRKNEHAIAPVLPALEPTVRRAGERLS